MGPPRSRSWRSGLLNPPRWSPVLTVGSLLVALLVGGVVLRIIEDRFVAAAGESLALAAVDIAGKLDLQMAERYGDIQMLARSRPFQEGDVMAIAEHLRWMADTYAVYEWLAAVDARGRIIAATDEGRLGQSKEQQPWFRSVRDEGRVVAMEPRPSEDLGGAIVASLTAPIKGPSGEFLGAVTEEISLAVLEDCFARTVTALQAQWGSTVRIEYQFLNREGEVIADSHLREEGTVNLKRKGLPSAQLFDSAPPGFIEERHLRRQVDVVTGYAMTKGIEELDAFRWGILVRVDRDDLLAPIRTTITKIGLAGGGMILPLVGALLWSVRRQHESYAAAAEERGRAQDAERKFQHLIEAAPDAILVTDSEGRIVLSNRQAERLFGFPPDELAGQPIEMVVPEQFRVKHRAHRTSYATSPTIRSIRDGFDSVGRRRNGIEFPAEIRLSHAELSGGLLMITVIRDMTRQRRAERELLAAKESAEAAARAKSDFLATMSHEIRTPMNGVIGMTDLLLDTELTAEQREFAETIRDCGRHLLAIINDILDFSKGEAGKLTLESIDFDLRATTEGVVDLLAERAADKGLNLACLFHADVPTALRGDPGKLRQILLNLIGNAIKFAGQGEVVVTVGLVRRTDNEAIVRFEVADTGVGIEAEAQRRLFQPFVQADSSTTRKYGGTGLGLAICKQLVRLMDGQIGVESRVGKGSTFWFTVQFQVTPTTLPPFNTTVTNLKGCRLCVVDDHATNRRVIELYAEKWGASCLSAENGHQALQLLRDAARCHQGCDVAIIDSHMPGMSGLDLAKAVKADPLLAATRLVLLTSRGQRGDAVLARDAGCVAYLTKPVRETQLRECLAAVLNVAPASMTVEGNSGHYVPASNLITRHSLAEARMRDCPRILLAEDNVVNQKVAVRMLEKMGYRVDVVSNGREAVEAVSRVSYAMVLMDCQMPVMDGLRAAAEIRRQEARGVRLPIIAMTANVAVDDRAACLAAGMDDFVSKPVHAQTLAAVLARWCPASGCAGRTDLVARHHREE
ncbi:response regulator [Candidatus Nitrospira inopinata]|uniref:response regulator n=1 Tax=Candidatus Nitrospira inopinata TaxID=1715989 RepID=UPI00138F981B|nr:response regulator [Candidatus Nitrospira inopinata]